MEIIGKVLAVLAFLAGLFVMGYLYFRWIRWAIRKRRSNLNWWRETSQSGCAVCGSQPAALFVQVAFTGMLVVSRRIWFKDACCESCAVTVHDGMQKHLLTRGWWSVFGVIKVPMEFVANRSRVRTHRKWLQQAASRDAN